MDDAVEYEYAVQMESALRNDPYTLDRYFPERGCDGEYWGDQYERQKALDWLLENFGSSKFWLVKRRKAGKVERV